MEKFLKMVEASNKRFPDGVYPYQMATRLLEECGEVAAEINHWKTLVSNDKNAANLLKTNSPMS